MTVSQRMFIPFEQLFTNLGIIGAGWKIWTYEVNTDTPLATYTTPALNIANSNPVVADANGRVPSMFVSSTNLYKAVLTDENDVVIETKNPVDSLTFTLPSFNPMPAAYWGTTAGTSTAYTLASLVDISVVGYSSNQVFALTFHIACGGSPTINIDGLGALNLKKYTGVGTKASLSAGDVQNQRYWATNDGTDIVILDIVPPASETLPGVIELATQVEVNAGTDATRSLTPATFLNASGRCIQRAASILNTQTSTTTAIPRDGSIPQNNEGAEFTTCAFTPKLSSSTLRITIFAILGSDALRTGAIGLFVDSTADALACAASELNTNAVQCLSVIYEVSSASTSARTYKMRFGSDGNTCFINSAANSTSLYGGAIKSGIIIEEFA